MKPCIRCNRKIDEGARLCPYCNWDQTEATPAPVEAPATLATPEVAPAVTPLERLKSLRGNRILMAAGGAALLIIAFVVGSFVHGIEPAEAKNVITTAGDTPHAPAIAERPAAVQLVPGGDESAAPITSAPDNSDATALGSTDYAQLTQTHAQQPTTTAPQQPPAFVDPRTVGVNGAAPPPARTDMPMASAATPRRIARTEPVPIYQPIPSLNIGNASTRLYLTVGSDGLVKDIDIRRPLPGQTVQLLSTVQNWRFRPATENGVPVAARFAVDITFRGDE